jgi:hypothetical protein
MKFRLINSFPLVVPAVSDMEFYDNNLVLISDSANEISICNQQGELIQILHSKDLKINELPKKDKADFEASTLINYKNSRFLLVLGSGSTVKNRNLAKLYDLNSDTAFKFYLFPFYDVIRTKYCIEIKDWNIEALACYQNRLYFFNRGTNSIFEVNQTDFFNFLEQKHTDFSSKIYRLKMNQLNGFELGISGVNVDENGTFYCTASAENTSDWYNDGEIIGSVIATFNIDELNDEMTLLFEPFVVNGKLAPIKLEAICQTNNRNRFFVASDNDGEKSMLYEIELSF